MTSSTFAGRVFASVSCLFFLNFSFAPRLVGQATASQQVQRPSGMSSGGIHPPVKDALARPITAGGFVDGAPVVFTDVTKLAGLDKFHHRSGTPEKTTILEAPGSGVALLDYDNDGWKDLLVAQGHDLDTVELNYPNLRYKEPMLLVRNTGKSFIDVSLESGAVFQNRWLGRGMAIGDIDNDGRIDAVVTTNDGPLHVLHNETRTSNHWLILHLVGHKSNRDAIGAEVKIQTLKGAQFATVTTAGSYLSSSDKRVHFGLGPESSVQSLEIRWPSAIMQQLKNVKGDQILRIEEPVPGIQNK